MVLHTLGHRGLVEDDGIVDPGTVRVDGVAGMGIVPGCIASWARGGQHYCGHGNDVVGLGTTLAWSTVSPAQVEEDGGTYRSSTVVGNDSVEAPGRAR
jgi:hypothetical protein